MSRVGSSLLASLLGLKWGLLISFHITDGEVLVLEGIIEAGDRTAKR